MLAVSINSDTKNMVVSINSDTKNMAVSINWVSFLKASL